MALNYIADVHISPATVSELKKEGYSISRITDFLPANTSDKRIIDFARKNKAVIVTQDLDFSSLIAQSGRLSPSVVSLRVGNAEPKAISKLLHTVLPQIETELYEGALVSVDEVHFRIRKLPVTS